MIESWNGTAWTVVSSPNPSKKFDFLARVSCTSTTYCVAVGEVGVDHSKTLVESWNGTAWSVTASPNAIGEGSALGGVSCVNQTDCVAVGTFEDPWGKHGTLVESWHGARWAVIASPNKASDSLSGVSCTSATNCNAVGDYFKLGKAMTLTENWNGTTWSIVPSANSERSKIVSLDAVSCSRSASCVAVGGNSKTLVESWDGTEWSITPSPNKVNGDWLNDVSCTSALRCVSIGFYTDAAGTDRTLIETT